MEWDARSDAAESSDAFGATDEASPEPDAGADAGATDEASPEPDAGTLDQASPEPDAGALDQASPEPDAGACIGTPCLHSVDCCPGYSGAMVGIACGAGGTCEACRTNGLNDPCLGGPADSAQSPDCCPGLSCVHNRCTPVVGPR
jgi:hypothetical protein